MFKKVLVTFHNDYLVLSQSREWFQPNAQVDDVKLTCAHFGRYLLEMNYIEVYVCWESLFFTV